MKGCRKCHHESEDNDSMCHMVEVNKGARKIMTEIPDQLTSVFTWAVVTGAFILMLGTATYLVLVIELSTTNVPVSSPKHSVVSLPFAAQPTAAVVNVTTREFCSTVSKELYSLERVGYVDAEHKVSKLMALDISVSDVHYVFTDTTHVSWFSTCALESTLKAIGRSGRVNVFVIHGIENDQSHDRQRLVSLPTSLSQLMAAYDGDRLNVVHVNLDECLECTPFQGMELTKCPGLARFVVQLVLLWQFGGTVLDAGVVAVRGDIYRADGTAVEYNDRTISSPVVCHAFVYDVLISAKSYAAYVGRRRIPFSLETSRQIVKKTVERTGRENRNSEVRPITPETVCHNGVVRGRCYYVEIDRGETLADPNSYVRGFCPTVSQTSLPLMFGQPIDEYRKHVP